ncbi:MAG: methyltransferase domain-containing protein [bacterium]|nr:methyltransferase domain-containing protein [bacterium]
METQRLADFSRLESGARVLEIGCGTGYIALWLAWRFPQACSITGIDLQPQLAARAETAGRELIRRGVALAPIAFLCADARRLPFQPGAFDAVVCNPPFFAPGASRPSPDPARRQARQSDALDLVDLFDSAWLALAAGGSLTMVLPHFRQHEAAALAHRAGFAIEEERRDEEIRKRSGGIRLTRFRKPALL